MADPVHPSAALYRGEQAVPVLPACEHFAGSESRILKAFDLQAEIGPVFDVDCDCEDGAPTGEEKRHAAMVAKLVSGARNRYRMAGARIHDYTHCAWRQDVDTLIGGAGDALAFLAVPKSNGADDLARVIEYVRCAEARAGAKREVPIHAFIETQAALREAFRIAALPGVRALAFGLLDFVSDHHGAIPSSAMRSPGQFEHALVRRAKAEVAAASHAAGIVPIHNITLDFSDARIARADAARAREQYAYLRMHSIHPVQIGAIVEAMTPDLSEVRNAADILVAGQAAGWAPIRHGGQMQDRGNYRYYWDLLRRAHAGGAAIPDAAARAFFQSMTGPQA